MQQPYDNIYDDSASYHEVETMIDKEYCLNDLHYPQRTFQVLQNNTTADTSTCHQEDDDGYIIGAIDNDTVMHSDTKDKQ